jgi:hypothetical protein
MPGGYGWLILTATAARSRRQMHRYAPPSGGGKLNPRASVL